MPGTREYFTCEDGEVLLTVAGDQFRVGPDIAVGYSVVLLTR